MNSTLMIKTIEMLKLQLRLNLLFSQALNYENDSDFNVFSRSVAYCVDIILLHLGLDSPRNEESFYEKFYKEFGILEDPIKFINEDSDIILDRLEKFKEDCLKH